MYMKETSAMRMSKSLLQSFENDEEEILILLNEKKTNEMIKDAVKNLPKYILNFSVDPSETFCRLMRMLNSHIREFGMFNHAPFTWLECILDEYAPFLSSLPNCKEDMVSLYKLITAHNDTIEKTKEQRKDIQKHLSTIVPKCIVEDTLNGTILDKVVKTPSCVVNDMICETVLLQVSKYNNNEIKSQVADDLSVATTANSLTTNTLSQGDVKGANDGLSEKTNDLIAISQVREKIYNTVSAQKAVRKTTTSSYTMTKGLAKVENVEVDVRVGEINAMKEENYALKENGTNVNSKNMDTDKIDYYKNDLFDGANEGTEQEVEDLNGFVKKNICGLVLQHVVEYGEECNVAREENITRVLEDDCLKSVKDIESKLGESSKKSNKNIFKRDDINLSYNEMETDLDQCEDNLSHSSTNTAGKSIGKPGFECDTSKQEEQYNGKMKFHVDDNMGNKEDFLIPPINLEGTKDDPLSIVRDIIDDSMLNKIVDSNYKTFLRTNKPKNQKEDTTVVEKLENDSIMLNLQLADSEKENIDEKEPSSTEEEIVAKSSSSMKRKLEDEPEMMVKSFKCTTLNQTICA